MVPFKQLRNHQRGIRKIPKDKSHNGYWPHIWGVWPELDHRRPPQHSGVVQRVHLEMLCLVVTINSSLILLLQKTYEHYWRNGNHGLGSNHHRSVVATAWTLNCVSRMLLYCVLSQSFVGSIIPEGGSAILRQVSFLFHLVDRYYCDISRSFMICRPP